VWEYFNLQRLKEQVKDCTFKMTLKVILIIIVILTNFTTLMMNVVSLVGNATTLVFDVPNTNKESTKKDVILVVDFDIVELVAISQKLVICEQFYSIKIIIAMKSQWCSIKSFLTFYVILHLVNFLYALFKIFK